MNAKTVLPAVGMTAVSMVLTLAVVVMWLGTAMPWLVALVVGLGIDGGWLATLAYERRLAAQGDHSTPVTAVGWSFGLIATGVLIAHALTADASTGAWLAVAWLPIAAKALWLVHGLWERTALTGEALDAIQGIQQEARDEAAVARARLRAEAATEETRLTAVTQAGARVAHVQAKTANTLSRAWSTLETAREGEDTGRALTSVTTRVTPGVTSRWELPVWGPAEPVSAFALETAGALTDEALDALVDQIRHSETPALSYREMASRFRAAGHSASEVRLRAAWKRMVA
ncbi:protein spdB [Streptomyces sp. NPDC002206]